MNTLIKGQYALISGNTKFPENNGKVVKLIEFEGAVNTSDDVINQYCQAYHDIWRVEATSTLSTMGPRIEAGQTCRLRGCYLLPLNSQTTIQEQTEDIMHIPTYIRNQHSAH